MIHNTDNTDSTAMAVRHRTPLRPPWAPLAPLAAGLLLGGLAGGVYGAVKPPVYTATSYVVAVAGKGADAQSALGFAQAYGRVATQLAVLGDAQVWAGVPAGTLRDSVRTATSPDAPVIAVSATSTRPDLATDMAEAVSRALTLHAEDTGRATHVGLEQFARATEPTEASSAPPSLTGLVGACAGGLFGGLLLLVRPRPRSRRVPDGAPAPAAPAVPVPGPAPASAPPSGPSPVPSAADPYGQP